MKAKARATDTWGIWDWGKPSRCVVASDGQGRGTTLWEVGGRIRFEIDELGATDLSDLGLGAAPIGLSVWEGFCADGSDPGAPRDVRGAFRELTDEEWRALRERRSPWSPRGWEDPAKRLIADAAEAQEIHGDDALEDFTVELDRKALAHWQSRNSNAGWRALGAFVDQLRRGGWSRSALFALFNRATKKECGRISEGAFDAVMMEAAELQNEERDV